MGKDAIRKEMLYKRKEVGEAEAAAAAESLMKNLFADFSFLRAKTAGIYFPLKGEVDTKPSIERAWAFGKTVFLPKIIGLDIGFCAYKAGDKLVDFGNGFLEPEGGDYGEPEAVVVPGLAFDLDKHRLGFGKGYFDRYLTRHGPIAIGACYEWQVVDRLPRERHDVRMDKIIAGTWIIE